MEISPPPHPAIDLSTKLYYQLVHTLTFLLPPPLDDTPEALHTRNHSAFAKVAALLPVNANEVDLAAQCIAARAQAEDVLRLLRQHPGDINLIIRLNAQYSSMVRASLSVHGRLMRVQVFRQKREAREAAANQHAGTQCIAEQSMLTEADRKASPREASPPKAAPVAPQTPNTDPKHTVNVSETKTNSHDAAFETSMSKPISNQRPKGSPDTSSRKRLLETTAQSPLAAWELPAYSRETLRRAA